MYDATGSIERGTEFTLFDTSLPAETKAETRERLIAHAPSAREASVPRHVRRLIEQVRAYASGIAVAFDNVQLDLREASDFRQLISRALQQVPAGQTVSYGQLAERAGRPRSARAVGRTLATNPWPLVVPCHRVLAKHGPGGFTAPRGLATKAQLLALEGVTLSGHSAAYDEAH